MINKINLKNKMPKKHPIQYIIFFITFFTSFFLITKINIYDSYKVPGLINCSSTCIIKITLPYNYIDIINSKSKINYQNKIYQINNIEYEERYLNNNIPYQDITLSTNLKTDNKIINIKILSNKQRVSEKIKNIILERN